MTVSTFDDEPSTGRVAMRSGSLDWIIYQYPEDSRYLVSSYAVVMSYGDADVPTRPCRWLLEGSNDRGKTWTSIGSGQDVTKDALSGGIARHPSWARRVCPVATPGAYNMYRLVAFGVGDPDERIVRLRELQLFGTAVEVAEPLLQTEPPLQADVLLDDADARHVRFEGSWIPSHNVEGFIGTGYRYAEPRSPQPTRAVYTPDLSSAGVYEVSVEFPAWGGRNPATPITIRHRDGSTTQTIDQRRGNCHILGRWAFAAGAHGSLTIDGSGSKGYVIADAVRFKRVVTDEAGLSATPCHGLPISSAKQPPAASEGGAEPVLVHAQDCDESM